MASNDRYVSQRYRLFSRFDEGIVLDEDMWFSITPEKIAEHIAERCRSDVIVDAFAGVGGNAIQFAHTCAHVISIEIDRHRVEMARNNASVYGVENHIEFICGDAFEVLPSLRGPVDAVFLSPPWGGPSYKNEDEFKFDSMTPYTGVEVLKLAFRISPNVAFLVPRNTPDSEIDRLLTTAYDSEAGSLVCEVEKNFLGDKLKTLTLYFGNLIRQQHPSSHDTNTSTESASTMPS